MSGNAVNQPCIYWRMASLLRMGSGLLTSCHTASSDNSATAASGSWASQVAINALSSSIFSWTDMVVSFLRQRLVERAAAGSAQVRRTTVDQTGWGWYSANSPECAHSTRSVTEWQA